MEILEVITELEDDSCFLRLIGRDVDGNDCEFKVTYEGVILDVFVDDEDGNEVVFSWAQEFTDLLEMTR